MFGSMDVAVEEMITDHPTSTFACGQGSLHSLASVSLEESAEADIYPWPRLYVTMAWQIRTKKRGGSCRLITLMPSHSFKQASSFPVHT